MPNTIEGWTAAATAVAGLLLTLWRLWTEFRAWRDTGDREALTGHLRELAPLAVVAIERLAAATPTKRDDEALAWVKRGLVAAGYPLPDGMEQHARDLLQAEYQRYKINVLGVPAHLDGAAAKAAQAASPSGAPGN